MSSQHGGMSIFIVKNVIMTIIGIREIWVAYLMAQEAKNDSDNNSRQHEPLQNVAGGSGCGVQAEDRAETTT